MMKYLAELKWTENLPNKEGEDALGVVESVFAWVYMLMGVAALIFLLYGVILYIASQGEPGKMQRGKHIIIYAIVGLVIVILASAITFFVWESVK